MTEQTLNAGERHTTERVVAQLDAEVAAINDVERAKLAAARRRAISRTEKRGSVFQAWHGVAAAAVLAVAVSVPLLQDRNGDTSGSPVVAAAPSGADTLLSDLPLLATSEDVDFYRDLEFLMWLETQDEHAT